MEKEMQNDIKELIVARLRVLPSDREISIGSNTNFQKDEFINHVEQLYSFIR